MGAVPRSRAAVDRVSPGDLTQLATDVGPVAMNVAAVLVLDPGGAPLDAGSARAVLARRVAAIPRLRQRLAPVPWGLGRPVWVEDGSFDPDAHITVRRCPQPGDRQALLDLATTEVTRPLPRSRPLWQAVLVTGLSGGQTGLILVLHHVLADGIGGLAVLAALADPGSPGTGPLDPRPPTTDQPAHLAPTPGQLAWDRAASLGRGLRGVPRAGSRLRRAGAELGGARRGGLAPRCSLNAPTGPHRHVTAVDVGLAAVRATAARHAATVNDVLLVAATAALEQVLAARGEQVAALVVSVPISTRSSTDVDRLGNEVGVMPVTVPLAGPLDTRVARVAAETAARRHASLAGRGASAALVGPVFRGLAAVGAFRWMIDRQRLVNTFLTNLRGPAEPLRFHDATVASITPITITAGNVTTAFAALSHAGTLTLSIITDPDRVPESDQLAAALSDSLHRLVTAT